MKLQHAFILFFLPVVVTVKSQAEGPVPTEPTCSITDTTCSSKTKEEVCSLWYDGEFVYSGHTKLKRGEHVGEPDVVIPWRNHDKWAWTAWHRYSYFYEVPGKKDHHVFSPGYTYPHLCHKVLGNFDVTDPVLQSTLVETANTDSTLDVNNAQKQSLPLIANRAVVRGDAIFTTCRHPDMSSKFTVQDLPEYEAGYFRQRSTCIDTIMPGPSTIPDAGMGAFAKYFFPEGSFIMFAAAMHMRRSELYNKEADEHELLLNYAFGHPQTQLLFLPAGPGVNYINHASNGSEANVKLVWSLKKDDPIENYFNDEPSHIIFTKTEKPLLYVRYQTLRDIEPGEEILLDYGKGWEQTWEKYVDGCGGADKVTTCKSKKPFRHEIGVPDGFFPEKWLKNEIKDIPEYSWDVPKLKVGEVRQLQIMETGQHPGSFLHRVGLPEQFHEKMREYADRIGVTDIMRNYVTEGNPLELGDTEVHKINGGNWWVKRFDSEWESNMHYITPDDERSNRDLLSALGEAGFDQVLQGMGDYFGLDGLLCYYASFIAVSKCSGSYPHTDAEKTGGKGFNMIFPVVQANESTPELMLGEDFFGPIVIPYRYEKDHAVVLGDDGVHHTAPADYRGTKEMRMVISVYMADINEKNRWTIFWDEDLDPPFPPVRTRMRYLMKNAGRDWKKGTTNRLPVRDESYA